MYLPLLSKFTPVLKTLFAEEVFDMKAKTEKKMRWKKGQKEKGSGKN